MRALLTVFGIIALIAGLVFMAQGSGYFPWPADSFMVNDFNWVYYGGVIAIAGILLTVLARP